MSRYLRWTIALFLAFTATLGWGANVVITSPANGATVYNDGSWEYPVTGSFVGPSDSTVLVDDGYNTRVAQVSGTTFTTTLPHLVGTRTVTVSVHRRDGTSDTASVSINLNDYPKVALISPSKDVHVDTPFGATIVADAASAGGTIASVRLYDGTQLLATLTAPPYQYEWPNIPVGGHDVKAVAYDNNGQSSSTSTWISVWNRPTAYLTAPANNSNFIAPASFTLTASATADGYSGSIAQVEFLQNGQVIGSTNVAPYSFSVSNLTPGAYSFAARATDNRGGVTTSASRNVAVTLPNVPPTVSLSTSVPSGSFVAPGGTVTLIATASDTDGTVARVEFHANNVLISSATAEPFAHAWTPSTLGNYQVTATAYDNLGGATMSAPVTVVVSDGVTYLHTDFTGNTIAATDSAGNLMWKENFRPYGDRLNNQAAAAGNRVWFHGKEVDDDTGLSYFGARYYDARLGRFMGTDPVGFRVDSLQSFNRYAYGNNNPYKYVDPDGRASVLAWGVGLLALGGVVYIASHPADAPYIAGRLEAAISNGWQNVWNQSNATTGTDAGESNTDGSNDSKSRPPADSSPIDETSWSGDHTSIKGQSNAGARDKVRVTPSGEVWVQRPGGSWENTGNANDMIGGSEASGRRGKDREPPWKSERGRKQRGGTDDGGW